MDIMDKKIADFLKYLDIAINHYNQCKIEPHNQIELIFTYIRNDVTLLAEFGNELFVIHKYIYDRYNLHIEVEMLQLEASLYDINLNNINLN